MKARGACVDLEGLSGLPPTDLGASVGERVLGRGGDGSVKCVPLVVDGEVICKIRKSESNFWLESLRHAKVCGLEGFKTHWELVGFDEDRQVHLVADSLPRVTQSELLRKRIAQS